MARKIIVPLIGCILVLVVGFIGVYKRVERQAQALPANNPLAFVQQGNDARNKVLVCIGDSITHGTVSVNYVDMLANRLAERGVVVVNAGINSELAYNVTQRLDAIVACDPDYITILIGTNDANTSLSPRTAQRAIKEMRLPQPPTREWFRENLLKVCTELSTRTHARIALLSLPPIGERLDHPAFAASADYSRIIQEVAVSRHLAYLPLHEDMSAFLHQRVPSPSACLPRR